MEGGQGQVEGSSSSLFMLEKLKIALATLMHIQTLIVRQKIASFKSAV